MFWGDCLFHVSLPNLRRVRYELRMHNFNICLKAPNACGKLQALTIALSPLSGSLPHALQKRVCCDEVGTHVQAVCMNRHIP